MAGTPDIHIDAGRVKLEGELARPEAARGLVLFAHGSGSSRHSRRNIQVAEVLQQSGFATLLFDLLTAEEESVDRWTAEHRFNVRLLASRLADATQWAIAHEDLEGLPIGYFGASTGAAAALIAAAHLGEHVSAVVSRGGRPDLADEALGYVVSPTLLIVGELDEAVIELNEQAYRHLGGPKELTIIARATHLFEEPGTLEEAAVVARDWFERYLTIGTPAAERRAGGRAIP